nr:DUF3324 domain-containing protein [Enterococcus hirae]
MNSRRRNSSSRGRKSCTNTQNRKCSNAPYSVYPFQFDWKKEELKPGDYIFKGRVISEKNTWEFTQKFTISEEQTKIINKESTFKVQIPS